MHCSHSDFQVSNFMDLTLVMEGPRARWAPEQFRQMKTPKSSEAPGVKRKVQHGDLLLHSAQYKF